MPKKKPIINELIATDADAELDIQVQEILAKLSDKPYEWLFITFQYDEPCEGTLHPTRDALLYDLSNALATHCHTAAVYHRGRKLDDTEFRALRAEALDQLGPISRAKAENRL